MTQKRSPAFTILSPARMKEPNPERYRFMISKVSQAEAEIAANRCPNLCGPLTMPALRSIAEEFIHDDPTCRSCQGTGKVCEDHPDRPWGDGEGCCGAAGMSCPNRKTKPALLSCEHCGFHIEAIPYSFVEPHGAGFNRRYVRKVGGAMVVNFPA